MSLAKKIKSSAKLIYDKLIKIDDSPQKIALGFGLGVFCGILPGTGPVAALALAFVFRVNKIAALTGGLLTNTWLSVVTFVAAIKLGSALTGADWQKVYAGCQEVIRNFNWENLRAIPVFEVILPLFLGYFIVGLASGCIGYAIALSIVKRRHKPGPA